MNEQMGIYESLVLPVGGGVIAGFIVIVIELLWRGWYAWIQRRKAVSRLRKFFAKWEEEITTASAIDVPRPNVVVTREILQFEIHKHYLRTAHNRIAPMVKHLNEQQVTDVEILIQEQNPKVEMVPKGGTWPQGMYDNFLDSVEKIEWLRYG